jgi:hypothetical protein
VIRNNYKDEEKSALVEFLAMLRGTAQALREAYALLAPVIRVGLHGQVRFVWS